MMMTMNQLLRMFQQQQTTQAGFYVQMWNKNMGTNFLPSWINCIDESMSKWINE